MKNSNKNLQTTYSSLSLWEGLRMVLVLLYFAFFASCEFKKEANSIIVKNGLDINRAFETVEVHKSNFMLEDLSGYGLKDENGQTQLQQYVDEDNDGTIDIILFQPTVAPNSESKYELFKVEKGEQVKAVENCYARFVPERTDDLAWENDKVAFRIFGPTAQQMFENGTEGGTLSSGIDCWLKRVDYPIINKWYKKHTEDTGSYHEDTGEGLDNFHVGTSRGCGGIAVKKDSSYYISKNFTAYKVLMNGAIRTSFQISYEDWDADGNSINESRIVSLDFGSNLSKYEVSIEGTDEISVGLTLHEKDGKVTTNSNDNWLSYWEPHGDSELGTAVLTLPEFLDGFEKYETNAKDLSNAFINLKLKNNKITYYAGFGWKKSGQFDDIEGWNNYLSEFSRKLKSPLKINTKQ